MDSIMEVNCSDVKLEPPLSTASLGVSGRCFIVTGGTQGLGLAIARLLAEQGAAGLALVSRNVEKGQRVCDELSSPRCTCVHVRADLATASDASSVVSRAVALLSHVGSISGVVNAAATTARGNLMTETAEGFDYHMAVNVRAPFLITQAAARHMMDADKRTVANMANVGDLDLCNGTSNNRDNRVNRINPNNSPQQRRGGSIVNICSCASYGGAPFVMAYSTSKAALAAMTRTHAHELAPMAIRVNAINMGWCHTDNEDYIQRQRNTDWLSKADAGCPIGRILRPIDVAVTAAFLLSDASNMMTASVLGLHPEYPLGMISLATTEQDADR